jgi:hypothetical protein
MMGLGAMVGLCALYLDGWSPQNRFDSANSDNTPKVKFVSKLIPESAQPISYFGLAFFGLRWWRMTDRRRGHWFSLGPILAARIWGFILMGLWRNDGAWHGAMVLGMTAAIVQMVSPWEHPLPPAAKRYRLRYA